MDKGVLSEYVIMKEEIKDLRHRIRADKRAIDELGNMVVTDSVTCGKKGKKPLRTVKIQGLPNVALSKRKRVLSMRMMKLQQLEMDLVEKQMQVEEYIQQIPKSELRIMFRMYYIDNLSYPKVAMRMNQMFPKRRVKYSDENIKKRFQRYFENVPQCPDDKC